MDLSIVCYELLLDLALMQHLKVESSLNLQHVPLLILT